jgi:hypothetical protein
MKETTTVGRLWDLVRDYLDQQTFPVSERALARKLGYRSSSTFDTWRAPRSLPAAQALARFSLLSGHSYQRVLDAALEDAGYLPRPEVTDQPFTKAGRGGGPGIDDEIDGPAPKVADINRAREQEPAYAEAARDIGGRSPGQRRRDRLDNLGEPPTDDPDDMEPR